MAKSQIILTPVHSAVHGRFVLGTDKITGLVEDLHGGSIVSFTTIDGQTQVKHVRESFNTIAFMMGAVKLKQK